VRCEKWYPTNPNAQVTYGQMMMNNILPVTLGNIVGGAVFVAGLHYWAYGRK
jgi:formate/nitrite transporter FocA (FNT family)